MALLAAISQAEKTTHNSHKFGFTLSPTNYGYWKAMLQPFLITNNLFGYVDGTIPCPPITIQPSSSSGKDKDDAPQSPQPNPNHATWISNDAHVRMLVLSTVSEASFQHVQGTTSRDLWLSLERAYAPHTSSREYTLKTQLLKIQMKSDETSSAYLTRAREYSDALANIGKPFSEGDLVMLVISGLRDEYNGLKSMLVARQFPTAFSELYGLLSDHEYMINKQLPDVSSAQAFTAVTANHPAIATPSDAILAVQQLAAQLGLQLQTGPIQSQSPTQQAQAFYTNRSGNNRGRGQANRSGHNRGRGNYNNYNNRNQLDSSNKNQNGGGNRNQFSWASNQNTVFGTCNRCGIGHIPSQCPNRDPSTYRRTPPSANYAAYRSQASTSWLPDTGSNSHVAFDHSGFEHSEPYYGEDSLHVGNGHVYTHYPPHGSK